MPIIVTASGSTAQNIIDRAMRLIQQLESGESSDANETADGLVALNAMLGVWRNERLMAYAIQEETVALTSGMTSTTLSSRPMRIEGAHVVYQGSSIPVHIADENEWAAIPYKSSISTYPSIIWYQPTMASGTLNIYPVPNASSTLYLDTRVPLVSFTSASDGIGLPPGWDDALAFNLAVRIAPEYETQAAPDVKEMAKLTKGALKILNARPIKATTELPVLVGRHGPRNILIDQ